MGHHGHFVETGLSVHDDDVAVFEWSFDDVADGESVGESTGSRGEVVAFAVLFDEVAGPLEIGGTAFDASNERFEIEACGAFRNGHVEGNGFGDADLVDVEVGVGGDDGARGKVAAFPHEIAADASCFADESLTEPLADLARDEGVVVCRGGDGRVEERADVPLEPSDDFVNNVDGVVRLQMVSDKIVGTNDFRVFVRQIIGHPSSFGGDAGANLRRRHWDDGGDHPLG